MHKAAIEMATSWLAQYGILQAIDETTELAGLLSEQDVFVEAHLRQFSAAVPAEATHLCYLNWAAPCTLKTSAMKKPLSLTDILVDKGGGCGLAVVVMPMFAYQQINCLAQISMR